MGGIRPALTWLEEALRAGKQVVTANKDLLAEYGEQLFDAAEAGKCDLHFEAAGGGGILPLPYTWARAWQPAN